jgi:hypothetical protein
MPITHYMIATPLPGQTNSNRPTTIAATPILMIAPRSGSSAGRRRAVSVWPIPVMRAAGRSSGKYFQDRAQRCLAGAASSDDTMAAGQSYDDCFR